MANTDGQIILGLDIPKTVSQINADIKKLQNQLAQVKATGALDTSSTVKQINAQIATLQSQLKAIDIKANVNTTDAQKTGQKVGQTVADTIQKTIDSKDINIDKLNADVKTLTNNLNSFSSKNAGFDSFKTEINGVEVSLDSLTEKLSTVDNITDLSTIRSQAAALKTAFTELAQINEIQLSMDNGDYDTQILAYETSLKKLGVSSKEVSEKMQAVSETYAELKASTTSDNIISDDVIAKAKTLETEMSKLENTVKQIKLKDSLQADDLQVEQTIIRLNNQLQKNGNYTKDSKKKIREWISELEKSKTSESRLREINVQAKELHSNMSAINRTGQGFLERIGSKIGTLSTYLSAATIISKGLSSLKNGISSIRELDTALVDLKKTTTMTAKELEDFYYASNETAKEMGVTTKEILDQASAWSRLGYSSAEAATKMAKYSSMFASISPGMNIDKATDGLVSMMKAYNIGNNNPDDVLDGIMSKINIIGNTAATSNAEIVNMLSKSSSAMAEANNTLEETIALETAAVEITRDDDSVGTAFKTISMRLRGYDEETEEFIGNIEELDGTIANLTKTASTPGGISLFTDDTKSTYKSTYQLLKEISEIYDQLSDKDQAGLLEALAGKRQGQIVAATINNFEAVEKALDNMANSAGSANAEMSVIMDSLDYKLNALKETGTGIAQNLFQRDDIKAIVDVLTKLAEVLDLVTDKFGLFGTAALGFGGIAGANNWG